MIKNIEIAVDIEKDLEGIASSLANSDDHTQSRFFNAFAQLLIGYCGSEYKAQLQMAFVSDKITPNTRDLFEQLCYVEAKND